jgi:chemotaxis signal transduction protein
MEDQSRELQLLRAGAMEFAIFTEEIAAIAQWREPTPLPEAPNAVLGIVSVQGRMLTVFDLAAMSNSGTGPADGTSALPTHIVALRGDEQLALAVTAVGETLVVSNSDLNQPDASEEKLILTVLSRGDLNLRVLNVKQLFPAALQGRERRRRRF